MVANADPSLFIILLIAGIIIVAFAGALLILPQVGH